MPRFSKLIPLVTLGLVLVAFPLAVPPSVATSSVGPTPGRALTIPLYGSAATPAGWGWTANNITEPGPTLTVQRGDVITFQLFSNDSVTHELIIDLDNSHTNNTGDAFSAQFSSKTTATVFMYTANTVGTFAYFCGIHGYAVQHGQLVVNGPPSGPSIAASAGDKRVVLTWQAPASNGGSAVSGYKVYRGTTPGGETLLATLGNVLTYTDSNVTNGQTYYYQVAATNAIGEGPKSSEVSAIPNPPSPASNSTVLIIGGVVIVVAIVAVAAAVLMRRKKP